MGSSATPITVLASSGDTYINFGNASSGSATKIIPDSGSSCFIGGSNISFFASVPIEGWQAQTESIVAYNSRNAKNSMVRFTYW